MTTLVVRTNPLRGKGAIRFAALLHAKSGHRSQAAAEPPSPRKAVRKNIRPVSWLGDRTWVRLPASGGGRLDPRPPIQLRGSAGFAPASRAPDGNCYYTAIG